ncbi:MAG: MoaD/ThiS family protein, partial [Promethearchaeota archaeon]
FLKEYKNLLDDSILSKNKKKLNPQMVILLNGRNITYMKNYKTKLSEGDQIYLSFPISGG